MIDGLMVTLTGEELQRMLRERADEHCRDAAQWNRRRKRTSASEDAFEMPEHICENEAEAERWRMDVLMFLHDHLDPSEVYRLGRHDLKFAELLPPRPQWMEQEEYEQRAGIQRVEVHGAHVTIRRLGGRRLEIFSFEREDEEGADIEGRPDAGGYSGAGGRSTAGSQSTGDAGEDNSARAE